MTLFNINKILTCCELQKTFLYLIDYINYHKLQQDHPCVIELIREQYLEKPAPKLEPLVLNSPEIIDPSAGQTKIILNHLNNKVENILKEEQLTIN